MSGGGGRGGGGGLFVIVRSACVSDCLTGLPARSEVRENGICSYEFTFTTPARCVDAELRELEGQLKAGWCGPDGCQ